VVERKDARDRAGDVGEGVCQGYGRRDSGGRIANASSASKQYPGKCILKYYGIPTNSKGHGPRARRMIHSLGKQNFPSFSKIGVLVIVGRG